MTAVAIAHPFVIGVDTHARTHTYAVIAASGEHLGTQAFPNTHADRNRAIAWAAYRVVEAPRAYAPARRGTGKSDPLNAAAIAAAALPLDEAHLRIPRQDDGIRAALRVLVAAREQMTLERTAKVNALTALPRAIDLGIDARKPLTDTQITEISHWRARDEELSLSTARAEAVRLAKRIITLDAELKDNHTRTTELLESGPALRFWRKQESGP